MSQPGGQWQFQLDERRKLFDNPSFKRLTKQQPKSMHKPQHSRYEQMIWNQRRFPKKKFFKAMDAVCIVDSKLTKTGFLLTHGDRGWLIASPVYHNGDIYRRTDAGQNIYGALSVLRQFNLECLLLSEVQVIERALKRHDFKRIKRCSDATMFDVAMLHDWPVVTKNPYSCAICLDGNNLHSVNIEPKARYNKPSDQFEIVCPDFLANELRARIRKL